MSQSAMKTTTTISRPLAISLLLGISGWVAGGFTLVFIAMLFRPDSATGAAFSGLILLVAAWWLFKVDRDETQVFVSQLALALSIAGQCFTLFAVTENSRGIAAISGAALVMQIMLALVMPNRLHRSMSTFFALIAWALTVRFAFFGQPSDWWRHGTPQTVSLGSALAAWVLAWGSVAALLWWLIRTWVPKIGQGSFPVLSPIVTGLVGGLAFATLASHPFESFSWVGGQAAKVDYLALWPLLSALGALGALTAAFHLRRRGLMAVCVIAVLMHISHFYYELGVSLLFKSLMMLVLGGLCLFGSHFLRSQEPK